MKAESLKVAHWLRVQSLAGKTSRILSERCPLGYRTWPSEPCQEWRCEWGVSGPIYNNCCFLAAEIGEHTLESVGQMLGVSRERIRQIENVAIRKLKAYFKDALHQQGMVGRNGKNTSKAKKFIGKDQADFLRAFGIGNVDWSKW